MKEPLIHSHVTDVLPDEHPLANEDVLCAECLRLVRLSRGRELSL
ncbi:MAG TPA: hypothetical protein VN829_03205 [Dongiaceae bacterium]|nr:hypothetical protein [Dongiaceae bacterium]